MRRLAWWASRAESRSLVILVVILLTAATLRLHGVGDRTLNHPEVYSPGIDLPWYLSNPNPRFTLEQTLKGSIAGEPHPPGYYILMLGWTKVFGSSILALRLPSVLFGVGSVLLMYLLGRLTADRWTGLLASAMLALNGFHLLYSQTARMYSMACFLGLLSTLLLVLLARRPDRPRVYCVLYMAVTVSGLATHVYVWPVFITQLLWVFVVGLRTRGAFVQLARAQILTFILASPLVAIAVYQRDTASRPPTLGPVAGVLGFLEAGALFDLGVPSLSEGALVAAAAWLALFGSLLLLVAAAIARDGSVKNSSSVGEFTGCGALRPAVMTTTALLMTLSILLFAYVANTLIPSRRITGILATSVLPPALALLDALLRRRQEWLDRLRGMSAWVAPELPTVWSLVLALAVVPVALVAAVSVLSPMLVLRGTLIFAPYLLLVLASALHELVRRDLRWVALGLMLAAVHGVSITHYKTLPARPDYKGLAVRWAPEIEASDLIFVHGRAHLYSWAVAPIYYYLNARRYRYVGRDFAQAVQDNPQSRVWVMSLAGIPTDQEVTDALAGYEPRKRVEAAGLAAHLYLRRSGTGSSPTPGAQSGEARR